ncbi:hypothetical protein JZ751_003604 [Albula glossodonta]|uniref:Uncharacterized protein n=1 Tax=Albula glossodonta TaxID=121402 RepID=A0A8T2N617_9TELE|nr:hypothetical protein JZ751_003604 [Albula glossodonta]
MPPVKTACPWPCVTTTSPSDHLKSSTKTHPHSLNPVTTPLTKTHPPQLEPCDYAHAKTHPHSLNPVTTPPAKKHPPCWNPRWASTAYRILRRGWELDESGARVRRRGRKEERREGETTLANPGSEVVRNPEGFRRTGGGTELRRQRRTRVIPIKGELV